jgi:DNA-directed RNA polymerase subunit M/transcription elongation factor TFIIS
MDRLNDDQLTRLHKIFKRRSDYDHDIFKNFKSDKINVKRDIMENHINSNDELVDIVNEFISNEYKKETNVIVKEELFQKIDCDFFIDMDPRIPRNITDINILRIILDINTITKNMDNDEKDSILNEISELTKIEEYKALLFKCKVFDDARKNFLKFIDRLKGKYIKIEGYYTCHKCHKKSTVSYQLQTRSADEQADEIVSCVDCNISWKV